MAQYRMLVTRESSSAIDAKDTVAMTFYLDTDALSGADDPQSLVDDTHAQFSNNLPALRGFDRIRVRAYKMSDPEPRRPVAEKVQTFAASTVEPGPREVALCLSYYAGQNVPRRRGRIFVGPWNNTAMGERPSSATRAILGTLANGISGLGGVNVQWVQFSPTTGNFTNVSNWWVDDEWDTVRSRGLRGTTRTTGAVSG